MHGAKGAITEAASLLQRCGENASDMPHSFYAMLQPFLSPVVYSTVFPAVDPVDRNIKKGRINKPVPTGYTIPETGGKSRILFPGDGTGNRHDTYPGRIYMSNRRHRIDVWPV